jgi:6-phosphogluconolactonase
MMHICSDYESLSRGAAGLFVEQAEQAVKTRGHFCVVLSGGSTPRRTYELLAGRPFRDRVAWGQVHVFWGDERCVPPNDPLNNARMARLSLLDHVPIPAKQVHTIECDQSPVEAAARFEASVRSLFGGGLPRFDLIFLGLGEDGHTGSLFPHTQVLREEERWVAEVHLPAQGIYRVTLTARAVNSAAVVAFLVSGGEKSAILQRVLQGS